MKNIWLQSISKVRNVAKLRKTEQGQKNSSKNNEGDLQNRPSKTSGDMRSPSPDGQEMHKSHTWTTTKNKNIQRKILASTKFFNRTFLMNNKHHLRWCMMIEFCPRITTANTEFF